MLIATAIVAVLLVGTWATRPEVEIGRSDGDASAAPLVLPEATKRPMLHELLHVNGHRPGFYGIFAHHRKSSRVQVSTVPSRTADADAGLTFAADVDGNDGVRNEDMGSLDSDSGDEGSASGPTMAASVAVQVMSETSEGNSKDVTPEQNLEPTEFLIDKKEVETTQQPNAESSLRRAMRMAQVQPARQAAPLDQRRAPMKRARSLQPEPRRAMRIAQIQPALQPAPLDQARAVKAVRPNRQILPAAKPAQASGQAWSLSQASDDGTAPETENAHVGVVLVRTEGEEERVAAQQVERSPEYQRRLRLAKDASAEEREKLSQDFEKWKNHWLGEIQKCKNAHFFVQEGDTCNYRFYTAYTRAPRSTEAAVLVDFEVCHGGCMLATCSASSSTWQGVTDSDNRPECWNPGRSNGGGGGGDSIFGGGIGDFGGASLWSM